MKLIDIKEKKLGKNQVRKEMAIRHTVNAILDGATYSILIANLMEDEYGLDYKYTRGHSERIIKQARELIRKDTEEQIPHLKEDMIARFLDIYTDAKTVGDRMNALKALEHINKLCGLYQDKLKVDADIKQEVIIDFGYDKDSSEN